jgi:hypothetical protein
VRHVQMVCARCLVYVCMFCQVRLLQQRTVARHTLSVVLYHVFGESHSLHVCCRSTYVKRCVPFQASHYFLDIHSQ